MWKLQRTIPENFHIILEDDIIISGKKYAQNIWEEWWWKTSTNEFESNGDTQGQDSEKQQVHIYLRPHKAKQGHIRPNKAT